ncbi:MAG: methyltransferase domain-containing protein [Acidobacteriota bacterium]|nr:methyltransferase domain-containing protein [Acidobacteriota bacterium]
MINFLRRWNGEKHRQRGQRALERQLVYQQEKAQLIKNEERQIVVGIFQRANVVRQKLEKFKSISGESRVLEVGSGAHGLIFGLGNEFGIGVDPLAAHYKRLFPVWQGNAQTIAAIGEKLPFSDSSFDVVLSDNVIDHAEKPIAILEEITRVLKPSGLFYFTVNVHHPIYSMASTAHGFWNALGIRYELSPFADHTVHFTESQIKHVFARLPLQIMQESSSVTGLKADNRQLKTHNFVDRVKKNFYKNAVFEFIAKRN